MKNKLVEYSNSIYPFHMPGHKLGRINPLVNSNIYFLDVTEVDGTDNLFHAEEIIKDAMDNASLLYQTKETFFLINGSSSGLLTAICSCCRKGGKMLVARNVHQSVFHGLMLHDIEPIYIYPEYDNERQIVGGICPNKIEELLTKHSDIESVIITSPTYEGIVSDIQAIATIVHNHGKLLIIDEAHGAHFPFHDFFPDSAIKYGADIVVQSLHKTLPSLTQTALLHVVTKRVNIEKLKTYLKVFQSSSPSYILMTSMDACIQYIQKNLDRAFQPFVNNIMDFEEKVNKLSKIQLLNKNILDSYEIHDIDQSKLLITGKKEEINGKELEYILRNNYGIQIEMASNNRILALTSIADKKEGFDLLYKALEDIDKKYFNKIIANKALTTVNEYAIIMQSSIKMSNIVDMDKEWIDLEKSIDRVLSQFIIIYPPGIPLLVPGEIMTKEIVNRIIKSIEKGLTILGIKDNKIQVIC